QPCSSCKLSARASAATVDLTFNAWIPRPATAVPTVNQPHFGAFAVKNLPAAATRPLALTSAVSTSCTPVDRLNLLQAVSGRAMAMSGGSFGHDPSAVNQLFR